MRAALAGAVAALAWAGIDPFTRRIFRTDYSDVRLVGLPLHIANGAAFGMARSRLRVNPVLFAVVEHVTLWPLLRFFDRDAVDDPRAWAKAVADHALFGFVLGKLS